MSEAIKGLKPERVWFYFAEIAKIPRCSKNEAKMTEYVVKTARKLGLEAESDSVGNVVVRKPGSAGKEKAKRVCLQGHLDMVCEKNKDKVHDFSKDPIELVRKGNAIMANGTTLGADNGIAIAMSLAIMEDKSLVHCPLEFLFTTDEETGLNGANNLAPGFVKSKTLINVDSEEEGALYVGCSGGRDTTGTWKVEFEAAPGGLKAAEIKVTGLKGGHSGLEIHKGRGNAIKIITRAADAAHRHGREALVDRRRQQAQRDPARGGGEGVRPEEKVGRGVQGRGRARRGNEGRAQDGGSRPRGDLRRGRRAARRAKSSRRGRRRKSSGRSAVFRTA